MNPVSRVTGGVIRHELHENARRQFISMCRTAGDGLVLLLLGPTQCGKSIILNEAMKLLRADFSDAPPGAIPIVYLQIETVSDGRAKPKWISIELLKVLHHPVYEHIGTFDEASYYKPSSGRDEGTLRIALKEAFTQRSTRRTLLDELHLLTRTKDPDLRAAILESLKSTCAINRTLIACGGYEIAYKGLFDSSHFCGRVLTCDFGHYQIGSKEHVIAWKRILKTYSSHIKTTPPDLLLNQWEYLLYVTNGVLGLLDKMLWMAKVRSEATNARVDQKLLRACAPAEKERSSILLDITKGQEALRLAEPMRAPQVIPKTEGQASPARSRTKPFERKANRNAGRDIAVHESD